MGEKNCLTKNYACAIITSNERNKITYVLLRSPGKRAKKRPKCSVSRAPETLCLILLSRPLVDNLADCHPGPFSVAARGFAG